MEPMTRRSSAAFAVLVGLAAIPLLASLASVPRAHSAFPGKNGFIAFSKLRHGSYDIYRMRPNGKGLRRLTNSPENDAAPAPDYSPNGKLIAYDSGGLGRTGYSHIFVMRANGTHQRQITHGNVVDGDPSFSGPHATRIAFASDRGHGHRYGIFIMRADGSHIKQLAGSRRKSAIQPAFSPNGKKVAYTDGDPNDFYDIYVMRADGSHKKRLTKWPYSDDSPSWSPSGKRIIFDRRVRYRFSIRAFRHAGQRDPCAATHASSPHLLRLAGVLSQWQKGRVRGWPKHRRDAGRRLAQAHH